MKKNSIYLQKKLELSQNCLESCQNLDEELRIMLSTVGWNFWSAKGVEQIFCEDEP